MRSLQDLGAMRDTLARAQREAAEAARKAAEEAVRLDRERRQFELAPWRRIRPERAKEISQRHPQILGVASWPRRDRACRPEQPCGE